MHVFPISPKYQRIPSWEAKSFTDEPSTERGDVLERKFWLRPVLSAPKPLHAALFICWSCLLIAIPWAVRTPTLHQCLQVTSSYSPAIPAIELYDTDFTNSFLEASVYRGPPTAEREQAWYDLWNQAEVLIPTSAMSQMNRTGDKRGEYLKAPMDQGVGYVGGLEVFHQLHCLNYVRQYTWHLLNSYATDDLPFDFRGSAKGIRIHADHCIETLRIALMCASDVSPVLVKLDHEYDPPRVQAEFSSHHKCRNFDKILQWNEKNGLERFMDEGALHDHSHDDDHHHG